MHQFRMFVVVDAETWRVNVMWHSLWGRICICL